MMGEAVPTANDLGPSIPGHRWAARPGIRRILGDFDAEVMDTIWMRPSGRGVTVREAFESLYQRDRRIKRTTVTGSMGRLARKGLLRVESGHGDRVYYPVYTRDEFLSGFLQMIRKQLPLRTHGGRLEAPDALRGSEDFLSARAREALRDVARVQPEREQ